MVTGLAAWLWELVSAASVEMGADQDAEVAFVDAGDGIFEVKGPRRTPRMPVSGSQNSATLICAISGCSLVYLA